MKTRLVTVMLGLMLSSSVFGEPQNGEPPKGEPQKGLLIDVFIPLGENLNVIDWRVGDHADYQLDMGFFGQGSVKKRATSEEKDAIWLRADVQTPMGNQTIDTLFRRSDGKVLKMLVDGKEHTFEEPDIEIIDQREESVTVPAGTFRAIYVKVRDRKQQSDTEAWVNPMAIPLGGIAKSTTKKSMLTITMELTAFGRAAVTLPLP